jgi:RNA polymerase sigma-70 factor (ECF subfamily)
MRSPISLSDEAGVRAAYAAHGPELYGFSASALGDRALAEEAVQETFLRAWRAADRFDPAIASLRTWLFAIMRNVLVDLVRARAVRPLLTSSEPQPAQAEDPLDRAMLAWQVEEALRRISEDHRRILVEVYYRGRPYAEVAELLGVPEGTVKSRVYYGLRALRLALEEMGVAG